MSQKQNLPTISSVVSIDKNRRNPYGIYRLVSQRKETNPQSYLPRRQT